MASLLNMSGGSLLGKGLPYDTEIEYLESTGTQYIDTGIKSWDTSIIIETEMAFTDLTVQRAIEGAVDVFYYGLNNGRYEVHYNTYYGTADTNYHIFKKSCSRSSASAKALHTETYLDGTLHFSRNGNYAQTAIRANVLVFAVLDKGVAFLFMKCKKKSFKLLVNGTLVRDFIPVRVGQVGYLYDKVSGKLFGNDGTGAFILGPDKN